MKRRNTDYRWTLKNQGGRDGMGSIGGITVDVNQLLGKYIFRNSRGYEGTGLTGGKKIQLNVNVDKPRAMACTGQALDQLNIHVPLVLYSLVMYEQGCKIY